MHKRRSRTAALAALLALGLTACTPSGTPADRTSPGPKPAERSPADVAVLVVDDFQLTGPATSPPGGPAENCAVGANVVGSGGAGDDLPLTAVTHGELVYRTLRDSLDASVSTAPVTTTEPAPALPKGSPRTVETSAEWKLPEGGRDYRIRLVAVDAPGHTTADVVGGLQDMLGKLAEDGFHRFVLNLSFVVLPCDPLALLTGTDQRALLESYLELAAADPELLAGLSDALGIPADGLDLAALSRRTSDVDKAVLTEPRLGPLRGCLVDGVYRAVERGQKLGESPIGRRLVEDAAWARFQNSVGQSKDAQAVVAVGAAGNGIRCGKERRASFRFPFAPALWDGVVSVSAANPAGGIMPYSNSGEVRLDGEGPSALLPGSHGTSFAAPRLSAYEAVYLLRTGRIRCAPTADRPPLAYVTHADVLSAATTGVLPWKDEDRPAWPAYCADFRTVSGA
ncbi:hypothetical protein QEZ54_24250 [Catellatospora sp. KI3]|uniref:hypothetical protein n=1 Tax=Catellatospora sp. KI3 TaxID=3041620 RepID=UPI0024827397|nr:hypothetical protein [Catellatospora sp. KI3]MDI1464103.1 hypothetical protein [Catellatospora sp. KI3]